jgi:hypothetical protein
MKVLGWEDTKGVGAKASLRPRPNLNDD